MAFSLREDMARSTVRLLRPVLVAIFPIEICGSHIISMITTIYINVSRVDNSSEVSETLFWRLADSKTSF